MSIQRHLPTLDLALAAFKALPPVAAAHDRCLRLYGRHVDALQRTIA